MSRPESANGRVAVMFDNFGPYHRARLEAAAQRLPICGIELSGVSTDYQWNALPHEAQWERRTLIAGGSSRALPAAELRSRLETLLEDVNPAVVAIPGWSMLSSQLASQWCARRGVPAIVMSESCAHDEIRRPLNEAVKSRLVGLHSAALVGGSAHLEYMVQLGMPADRVFIGYDAIDNFYFAAGSDEARTRGESLRFELKLPPRYFLASARFIEKKNLFTVLDAYAAFRSAALQSGAEPWSLVILGDGILGSALRARVVELGLESSVSLPGFQQYPVLPAYYGFAAAFIHASTTEQWGLVVNEAMASGLPVLVSNRCGCAPDLVRDGENGFRFDPLNTCQLTEQMTRLASGSCNLEAMGRASRRIVSDFAPARFGDGLQRAVARAQQVGSAEAGIVTRVLLHGLIRRHSAAPVARTQ